MAPLRDLLVLKGGTALKKCYFGDYRFSEDLDFSIRGPVPNSQELEDAVRQACGAAAKLLDEHAPVELACERYIEKEPHPGGQEAFLIRARDDYDIWRVLRSKKDQMDLTDFAPFLHEKCAGRNVAFSGAGDFFTSPMLSYVERTWDQWLGPLVPGLPPFAPVIGELRPQVEALIPSPRTRRG